MFGFHTKTSKPNPLASWWRLLDWLTNCLKISGISLHKHELPIAWKSLVLVTLSLDWNFHLTGILSTGPILNWSHLYLFELFLQKVGTVRGSRLVWILYDFCKIQFKKWNLPVLTFFKQFSWFIHWYSNQRIWINNREQEKLNRSKLFFSEKMDSCTETKSIDSIFYNVDF
jgi:hypothetical protein